MKGRSVAFLGGSPAAWGCSIDGRRDEVLLMGAA